MTSAKPKVGLTKSSVRLVYLTLLMIKSFTDEQGQYFVALKALVEDTYELNHKTPVTFIAHSLGCLYLLYFLNRQTQDWKDKYVSSFMGLGGPWGGAVKPLKVIASGDDLGISIVSHSRMREVLRTNPSVRKRVIDRFQCATNGVRRWFPCDSMFCMKKPQKMIKSR